MEDTTRRQVIVLVQTITRARDVDVSFTDLEGVAGSGPVGPGSGNAGPRSAGVHEP
jgi:hypothetical protein